MGGGFERFIGIDWSGAARPSGQHVYMAEAHRQDGRNGALSSLRRLIEENESLAGQFRLGAARSCYRLPPPQSLPPVACRREGWIAGVQVPARRRA